MPADGQAICAAESSPGTDERTEPIMHVTEERSCAYSSRVDSSGCGRSQPSEVELALPLQPAGTSTQGIFTGPREPDAGGPPQGTGCKQSKVKNQTARRRNGKTSSIAISGEAGRALAEVLQLLAAEHELSPIHLREKPSKEELTAILNLRAVEIRRLMT